MSKGAVQGWWGGRGGLPWPGSEGLGKAVVYLFGSVFQSLDTESISSSFPSLDRCWGGLATGGSSSTGVLPAGAGLAAGRAVHFCSTGELWPSLPSFKACCDKGSPELGPESFLWLPLQ